MTSDWHDGASWCRHANAPLWHIRAPIGVSRPRLKYSFWELLLGIWLLVRGFNPVALAALDARQS